MDRIRDASFDILEKIGLSHAPKAVIDAVVARGGRTTTEGRLLFPRILVEEMLGELGGGLTPRLKQIESVWQGAGFNVKAYENITQLVWEKFLCNVTFSAPCTVFRKTVGELMADLDHSAIALGAMSEAYEIACAKGMPLSFDDPVAYVTAFGAGMPQARPSMLLDHIAGRVSELDAINGIVPILGREVGVPTPYNETLAAILRQREARFAGEAQSR